MLFPSSPVNGQSVAVNGVTYIYESANNRWKRVVTPITANVLTANVLSANVFLYASNGASILSDVYSAITGANVQIATLQGQVYTNSNVDAHLSSSGAGNITISGGAFGLTATGPGATTVGGATAIPVITTDAYGRITALTTASVSSTLNTSGTTGTGSVSLTNQNLTINGTYGVTATASGQTITIATPQDLRSTATPTFGGLTSSGNTVVNSTAWISGQTKITNSTASTSTSTGALQVSGGVGIGGDVYIGGNLTAASLNSTTYTTLLVNSSMAYLQGNTYPYDFDIGMYSHFRGGPANAYTHTGVVRSSQTGYYGFFSNVKSEPAGTVNWADSGLIWDTVKAGALVLANTNTSTSTTTGALQVAGGAGVAGNVYAGGQVQATNGIASTGLFNGTLTGNTGIIVDYRSAVNLGRISLAQPSDALGIYNGGAGGNLLFVARANGEIWIPSSAPSTSTTTGALQVSGGVGVAGNVVMSGGVYTSGLYWSANGNVMASGITYTASSTAPAVASANKGDQWYNTSTDVLYELLNDGTTSYWVDTSTPVVNGSSVAGISANLNPVVNGNIFISGNLTPTSNVAYDLGSPTNSFKSLFLSGNTIHLDGAKITTDPTTGAFAMVPRPTLANPNPLATVFDPYGTISQVPTTGGLISAGAINNLVQAAATNNSGTTFANLTVQTVANVGRLVTSTGIFWSNGTAYSSGSTYGNTQVAAYLTANPPAGTYSNTTVASYLPVYSGNVASGNASVTTKLTAGSITTTNGVFWANGTAYSSGSGGTTLPSQSGNSGKYLTTDGSSLSWGTVAGGGGGGGTTTNALSLGYGLANDSDLLYSLLPPTVDSSEQIGSSVATNGTYTVVSAHQKPAIYVYLNSTGALHYKISGVSGFVNPGQDRRSVAINSANVIVVSDTQYGSYGRVQVFDMSTWSAYSGSTVTISSATTTITPPDNSGTFGRAVAISDSYIVISNPSATAGGYSYAGIVYLYTISGTLKYKITDPTAYGTTATDGFGTSVAISGNKLVAGAPYEGDNTYSGSSLVGKLYVFNIGSFPAYSGSPITISSSNYTSYGFAIDNPFSEAQSPYLGYEVATDGTYILGTAINVKGNVQPGSQTIQFVGAVYVFDASNGTYLRRINSPAPITNAGQAFGQSIAINGSNMLIGESYEDVGNALYVSSVYLYSTTDWKLKKVISSPNAVGGQGGFNGGDQFGHSVALSGNYAVVGAPYETVISAQGWPYGKGGAAYVFNINRTFDGSSAMTVSLAPTNVIPGLYGLTDGSTYINVPQLQIDHYGRVLGATQQQFSVTQGLDHAFSAILVNGSEAFTASSADSVNFQAGTNVTLSSGYNQSGQKTITINSTGGGSSGGGGGSSVPFSLHIGPAMLTATNGTASFTAPAAGIQLIEAFAYNDTIMTVGGPGNSFNQLMGPYTQIYGPGGSTYPWYSMSSLSSGANINVYVMQPSSQVSLICWTLDSSTNINSMTCYRGNVGGYIYNGSPMNMQDVPSQNGVWMSNGDYFYGVLYLQGGGDLSLFEAAPGVTFYYDTTAMMGMVKVPASIWQTNGSIGTLSGYNGSWGTMGYFFGQ